MVQEVLQVSARDCLGTREEMSLIKFLGFFILSKWRLAVWKEEEVETSREAMVLEFQIENYYNDSIH